MTIDQETTATTASQPHCTVLLRLLVAQGRRCGRCCRRWPAKILELTGAERCWRGLVGELNKGNPVSSGRNPLVSITHIAGIFPLLVRLLALRQVVIDRAPDSSLPLPGADLWLHVRDRRTHVSSLSRAWLRGATVYRSVSTGRLRILTRVRIPLLHLRLLWWTLSVEVKFFVLF